MVEYIAHHARRDPTPRAASTHQSAQGARTESRARGLQFHEAKDPAVDGSGDPGLRVHRRRRRVEDAGGELDDNDIIERLSRIFKDMPPYTACPVEEYSAAHPPKEVSSRTPLVE
jgi:hypothetical protein